MWPIIYFLNFKSVCNYLKRLSPFPQKSSNHVPIAGGTRHTTSSWLSVSHFVFFRDIHACHSDNTQVFDMFIWPTRDFFFAMTGLSFFIIDYHVS